MKEAEKYLPDEIKNRLDAAGGDWAHRMSNQHGASTMWTIEHVEKYVAAERRKGRRTTTRREARKAGEPIDPVNSIESRDGLSSWARPW